MIYTFVILLLLAFGPVVDIGLGQLGDTSFVISLCIIAYALLAKRIVVPLYIKICLALIFCIFVLALFNTLFLDPFEIEAGFRAIFRPVRVFIVVLSCFYCIVFIDRRMADLKIHAQDRFLTLIQMLYLIVVLHGLLMCLQFVFPDFRDFIYSFTFAKDQIEYNKMFRMAGLTGAGGAQTSFVQGLGCLLGWFLLFYKNYKYRSLVLLGNIVIVFSIILSGRTGLLVVVLGFMLCLFLSIIIFLSKAKQSYSFNPFYLLLILPVFFVLNNFPTLLGDNFIYFETAFNRTFKTLIDFSESGTFQDDTVSALSDMIILPDQLIHLMFGRASYLEGNTYYNIMTDIGYFRLIWGYGILGLFMHVLFYLVLLFKIFRLKLIDLNDFYLSCLPVSIIGFVFLMNSKEIFFMTRISSHITFIVVFYFIFINELRRKQAA